MLSNLKEKILSASGSVSGAASILGSWQICHAVCLGIIALLSVVGIVVVGMPLLFLTKIAVPMWIFAAVLFGITVTIYITKKCISRTVLLLNAGLLIAGIPFQAVQSFSPYLWSIGGTVSSVGIVFFVREKMTERAKKGNLAKKGNAGWWSIIGGVALGLGIIALIYVGTSGQTSETWREEAGAETTRENTAEKKAETTAEESTSITTGSTESGDVEITLTPEPIRDGQFIIKVSANTHSVDLSSFDLTEITTLEYEGRTVAPVSAPTLSGHHASGEIIFAVAEEITEYTNYTIRINGIPKEEQRIYSWGE